MTQAIEKALHSRGGLVFADGVTITPRRLKGAISRIRSRAEMARRGGRGTRWTNRDAGDVEALVASLVAICEDFDPKPLRVRNGNRTAGRPRQ